jgi:threonine dehydrogenase-like Zn-dependent dehydrogenase
MKAVGVTSPGEISIVELPTPELGPYDVLVKTEISFICNATDRKVVDGTFPGLGPENYPLLLGHESVGIVVETGDKVTSFETGERAIGGLLLQPPGGEFGSGWGGHSEYVLIRDHKAMLADGTADAEHGWDESFQIMRTVPTDIPPEAAGLLCTWREVYAGMFTDFRMKKGEDIVVFGAGPVGLSFIKFAKIMGLGEVISVDPLAVKRELALKMGATRVMAPDDPELDDLVERRGGGFDAVVDAVGRESIINTALTLVRMAGSICVYGVLGQPRLNLNKEDGPYNFNLFVHQWPTRNAEAAAQDAIIPWIREGVLDWRDFVTGSYSVKEVRQAVEAVKEPTSVKTMLVMDEWS